MPPNDQRKAALLTGSSLAILLLAPDIHNYTCHSTSPTSYFHHCRGLCSSVLGPFFTLCQFCMLWTQTSPRNEESLLKHTCHLYFPTHSFLTSLAFSLSSTSNLTAIMLSSTVFCFASWTVNTWKAESKSFSSLFPQWLAPRKHLMSA